MENKEENKKRINIGILQFQNPTDNYLNQRLILITWWQR